MAQTELAVACFRLGPFRLAIEASQVVRILADNDEDKACCADAEQTIAGLTVSSDEPVRIMVLRQGRYMRVNQPVTLVKLPLQTIYPLPALVAVRMQSANIKAFSLDEDCVTLLVVIP